MQISYNVYRSEGGKKVAVATFTAWSTPNKVRQGSYRTNWNTAGLPAGTYAVEAQVAVGSAPEELAVTAGK